MNYHIKLDRASRIAKPDRCQIPAAEPRLTDHLDTSLDAPLAVPPPLLEAGVAKEPQRSLEGCVSEQPVGATRAGRRAHADDKPTPREKWGRVTVELPLDVIDQLKERALRNRCSVRYLVMKALRTANIRIRDADMIEDARKGNGRKGG